MLFKVSHLNIKHAYILWEMSILKAKNWPMSGIYDFNLWKQLQGVLFNFNFLEISKIEDIFWNCPLYCSFNYLTISPKIVISVGFGPKISLWVDTTLVCVQALVWRIFKKTTNCVILTPLRKTYFFHFNFLGSFCPPKVHIFKNNQVDEMLKHFTQIAK